MELKNIMITLILLGILAVVIFIFMNTNLIESYEETKANITIFVNVRNLGSYPALEVPLRLALPTNNSIYQQVDAIEYSKVPEKFTDDYLGNKFVHYTFDQINAFSSANVSINVLIKLKSTDFYIDKDKLQNYDDTIKQELYDSALINYNEVEIQQLARDIAKNSSNILDIAWNSYDFVASTINYQQVPGEWDALTTLKNGEGGSAELGNLYVALLKANGIPSRRLSGWAKKFKEGESYPLTQISHGWTEFYLPEYGWIPVDPTWGKKHRFDYFAKTYPSHIIITRGAGVHFMRRGSYTEPYGKTELKTEYTIQINSYEQNNLSKKRMFLFNIIYLAPLLFIIFIILKYIKQRKEYNR